MQKTISIQSQIEAIKEATKKALQSKEAAIKFLQDAGIMEKNKDNKTSLSSTHHK